MEKTNEDFTVYLAQRKALVEEALDRFLSPGNGVPERIMAAARYSLFAGGKRLRPILCLAAAEAVSGAWTDALPCACALEMIHTYSLIHDDLPAMDDDDYRRGRPTNHIVFGEALAILAGDALLTEAFHLLARRDLMTGAPPEDRLEVIRLVAQAAGMAGMVGGQTLDLQGEGRHPEPAYLTDMHRRKTGALLIASVVAGAVIAGATDAQKEILAGYGEKIGLAFQIADDILNVTGDRVMMGKSTGSDAVRGKQTFPALLGLEVSQARLAELVDGAAADARRLGERGEPLVKIAKYIMERKS
ncbi:MAG: polyprenyl synthetase family protein [Pseudomonadota bacterium]|nr:polyprenyl synthetase family protein [Pseudomonadota bacterium]